MSSTLLEQTRAYHEECERLERYIVKDFKEEQRGHRERMMQGHRVRLMMERIQETSQKLLDVYKDEDGARKEDIASLHGDEPFKCFYQRYREMLNYHRRFPAHELTQAEPDRAPKFDVKVEFSGEEVSGRYLDLHDHFRRFINSKFGRKLEYPEYVSLIAHFDDIPRHQRLTQAYRDYLQSLVEYLEGFYKRTQPLQPLDKVYVSLRSFEADWEAGTVPGWENYGKEGPSGDTGAMLDMAAFDSVEELMELEPHRLKEALGALGLKTGGTLRERAQRLWLTKDRPLEQIELKHFQKGMAPAAAKSAGELAKERTAAKASAYLEAKVQALEGALGTVVEDTRNNVEKKQARTYEELLAEQQEAELELAPSESDDDDEFVYNPLKLPLGWDGKPIPYWLYKLHGLNQEFKCEICGNSSYWGRRAFERHFREARHQQGMRALGIPNNKNFYEVTQIEDAKALWANIQDREVGGFKAELEEEFEDADGNVYPRKMYEDLKRQGII